MHLITSIDDAKKLEGQEVGLSDWIVIDQNRIDLFAEATDDYQWIHVDVDRAEREMPDGRTIAHGYLTLTDSVEMFYQVAEVYHPELEDGVRWDDPTFGIEWPNDGPFILSPKDRSWPDYSPVTRSVSDTETS